ncbi:hypothetical protein D3C80_959790 [compost metagenome]
MRVDTEADGALGVAGLEGGQNAVGPLFAVALAASVVTEVAVEVVVLVQQNQTAVLDEAFRLGLRAGHGQLGGARGDGERDGAQFHHLHIRNSPLVFFLKCLWLCEHSLAEHYFLIVGDNLYHAP